MNSGKRWRLRVAKRVDKKLRKFPAVDRDRILKTLEGIQRNPFAGDIVRLNVQPSTWRRRVGDYRIFFDADPKQGVVDVLDVVRRTSTNLLTQFVKSYCAPRASVGWEVPKNPNIWIIVRGGHGITFSPRLLRAHNRSE